VYVLCTFFPPANEPLYFISLAKKKKPTLTVHLGPGMYGESWSIFIFELFLFLTAKKIFSQSGKNALLLLYYMAKKDKEEEEEKIDHQFSSVTHR
jgi:hypothetical protein